MWKYFCVLVAGAHPPPLPHLVAGAHRPHTLPPPSNQLFCLKISSDPTYIIFAQTYKARGHRMIVSQKPATTHISLYIIYCIPPIDK